MHEYGKIYHLGHKAIEDILKDDVIVEEKIDGSQISFGVFDGDLKIRSHHKDIDPFDAGMFSEAVDEIVAITGFLKEGWVYRGEYLRKPKHNALAYDRIPKNHIIIFDIDMGNQHYMDYEGKAIHASSIGLETVPKLFSGTFTFDLLNDLLETTSILGGQKIEGVVIKNYSRFGRDSKCLMGKYVSEKFKEISNHSRVKTNKGYIIDSLAKEYKTEARWDKALIHLKEKGELSGEPKDIGSIIKEIQHDVKSECEEEIKDALFKWAWPQFNKRLSGGVAEWYKEKLVKNQFGE